MGAVWRRTAAGAAQSPRLHASRAWKSLRQPRRAALELGAAAQAGVFSGYGYLPVLPSGDAADDRRHHPGRGDPQDAPPSEARGRPAAACPGSCAPSHARLGRLRGVAGRRRGAGRAGRAVAAGVWRWGVLEGVLPRCRRKMPFKIPSMLPLLSSPFAHFFLPSVLYLYIPYSLGNT